MRRRSDCIVISDEHVLYYKPVYLVATLCLVETSSQLYLAEGMGHTTDRGAFRALKKG